MPHFRAHTDAIIIGPRHYDPTMRRQIDRAAESRLDIAEETRKMWRTAEQGFIDQWGVFMDRHEAFNVAKAAGQILYGPHLPGEALDSSDLY